MLTEGREDSCVGEWVCGGMRSMVGKEMASILPRRLVGWVCPLCEGVKRPLHVWVAMNRGVQEQSAFAPSSCKAQPRCGAFHNESLGLSSTCSPWQWEASKGEMDKEQLEPEGSEGAPVSPGWVARLVSVIRICQGYGFNPRLGTCKSQPMST